MLGLKLENPVQLNDVKFYRKQDEDITNQIQQRVTIYVQHMLKDGYIDEKTKQYLIQTDVKPGRFYILPKIHKTGNPGGPIVSSNSHPTERISQFVDYHINPLVSSLEGTQVFWHQSEARTAATVWNWSGKTLSPGALLAVLYFSSCHIFFRPFRLFLVPTICPWVSEDVVFVRSCNFGWWPAYDCKAYLGTNTVKSCSYFGFGGYSLVSGTIFWSLASRIKRTKQMKRANHG